MSDSSKPEKLNLESLNIADKNKEKLKKLFPCVFSESLNDKGELVESIDFEKLKAELGTFSDVFENRQERYGMNWPGKRDAMKLIQEPSRATLKPCKEESVDFDTTENLFIEGDNLEVLKLLQKSYYGKVKMIYIDPPYNTGNEFIYPDKYSETLETYLEYTGQIDSRGKKFSTNTESEGRYHTKWMNMMYPRLYLARNLLREDGVIFISIDDNEVDNLKKICNEIFGEENLVANIIWERAFSPKNDAKYVSVNHDYLLVYSKNIAEFEVGLLERTKEANSRYTNPDNDSRGVWFSDNLTVKTYSEKYDYPIETPGGRIVTPSHGSCWRISQERLGELIADKRIWFGEDGNNVPRLKRFLSEVQDGMVATTLWHHKEVGHNQEGRQEVKKLFDEKGYFDGPKPVRLISRVLRIANVNDTDIILDFFSGSCTTAHAVLDLNREDGGNRKFIMVQLPEACDEKSEAYKAGYKTIADIGKERIRRVINKIKEENEGKLPLGDNNPDLGFKVFKLDRSCFNLWDKLPSDASKEQIAEALQNHLFSIDKGSSKEDILYEILIKAGFMPTEKLKTIELAAKNVYSISDQLLLYLGDEITMDLINAVAGINPLPMQFICLDSAFNNNDKLKTNAVQTFKAINNDKDSAKQIVFRTV